MTMIPCMICGGDGSVEDGRSCPTCNGSGEIEAGFGMTEGHRMAMFNMIVGLTTAFSGLEDKIDDVMDKCIDIKEKLDET